MPRWRIDFRCFFLSGRLLELLPKASNSARTSTPSFTFSASRSKSMLAIESLRKLKYSRCTLLRAWRIALNMSSNFSCPFINSVTELLRENFTPSFCKQSTISESLVCATELLSHRQAVNNTNKYLFTISLYTNLACKI